MPHKAAAEVSTKRDVWTCVFGAAAAVAVVTSPQLLDVVWRSAVVAVAVVVA